MFKPRPLLLIANIVCCAIFTSTFKLKAQTNWNNFNPYEGIIQLFDSLNDPDHDLINGRLFRASRITTYGHPYLGDDDFSRGEITINNNHFKDIPLKYDIVDQNIIVWLFDETGSNASIILNNVFVQDFTFNNKHFISMEHPELGKNYFQKLGNGYLSCYYFFSKRAEEKAEGNVMVKQIHDAKRTKFLLKDGIFQQYKSNRTFIKKFDEANHAAIKKYIKSRKLNIKTISDKDMVDLLLFCETLILNE